MKRSKIFHLTTSVNLTLIVCLSALLRTSVSFMDGGTKQRSNDFSFRWSPPLRWSSPHRWSQVSTIQRYMICGHDCKIHSFHRSQYRNHHFERIRSLSVSSSPTPQEISLPVNNAKKHEHANEERSQRQRQKRQQLPRHVAFVLDGNGRWAERRGLPLAAGHERGARRVTSMLERLASCPDDAPECCTLYVFSTENWSRSAPEIAHIWSVVERTAASWSDLARERNVRVRVLGDLDDPRVPPTMRDALRRVEHDTADDENDRRRRPRLTVALAVNYGGRQDILAAAQRLVDDATADNSGRRNVLTTNDLESELSTADLPPLDMVVRTGGERRMSNFLLWDAAYAELYFTDTLWPDFDDEQLDEALRWFADRQRRFGGRQA